MPAPRRGHRRRPAGHRLHAPDGQRPGEVGRPAGRAGRRRGDRGPRAGGHPGPHRGDAGRRRAPTSTSSGWAAGRTIRVRRSTLSPGTYSVPGRPVPGGLLGGGRCDRPGQPGHRDRHLPGHRAPRLPRRAPADGRRHRDRGGRATSTGSVTSYACALHGTVVEAAEIPSLDEVPILAVAAAVAHGTTRFRDVGELRVKESDRLAGTAELVARLRGRRHRRRRRPGGRRRRRAAAPRPASTPAATTGWPWPPPWPARPARRRRPGPPSPGGSRWPPAIPASPTTWPGWPRRVAR